MRWARVGSGELCPFTEVSELKQGCLHVINDCFFSWLYSSVVKHKACVWALTLLTSARQKGQQMAALDHQRGSIWNWEGKGERWAVTESACCAQARQFSPLL